MGANNNAPLTLGLSEESQHFHFAHENQLEQLVKNIKEIMASKSREGDQVEELIMIDAIQRLGLQFYFQDDIHAALKISSKLEVNDDDNLHDVALRFRLLRQEGYNVQAVIFNRFKDKDGEFKQELKKDTKGLLSLFEASHLSIPGDDILDEAGDFSRNHLETTLNKAGNNETTMIGAIINNPYHSSLPRLTAENQLPYFVTLLEILHDCFGTQKWIKDILDLARIVINLSKTGLQNEVTQVSRWWKELGMADAMELARNQPKKWYMWSAVALPSPDKAELRIELTKSISFIYIIDDIYDVYGKIEELALFTEAVNKWDYANINGLPDYMKTCLKALFDTMNDMSEKLYLKHGWHPNECLQKAWAELCNAFLVEARWFRSEHLPTTEDYLKNGILSSGVYVVSATLFCLLGEEANNGNRANVCSGHPDIVTLTGTLLRLWDDLGSAKDEDQDGHDGSFVACFMNEHQGSSDELAQEVVFEMISNAWKGLNEECLSHSPFSMDFKTAFLNLARMIPIMYKYDDNHRLPTLEKHMKTCGFHE